MDKKELRDSFDDIVNFAMSRAVDETDFGDTSIDVFFGILDEAVDDLMATVAEYVDELMVQWGNRNG